jgi:hypothetical protein
MRQKTRARLCAYVRAHGVEDGVYVCACVHGVEDGVMMGLEAGGVRQNQHIDP